MNRTRSSRTAIAVALSTLVVLAGCSGEGRPSVDDVEGGLTVQLEDTTTEPEVLGCLAGLFHDSELSDEALRAIADQDDGFEADAEDAAVLAELSADAATSCGPQE